MNVSPFLTVTIAYIRTFESRKRKLPQRIQPSAKKRKVTGKRKLPKQNLPPAKKRKVSGKTTDGKKNKKRYNFSLYLFLFSV